MEMNGYKGFESNLTCLGFQYEIGKTYKHDGEIELCESGFHFCKTIVDVLKYYNFSNGHRFCKIKAVGKIIEGEDKCVTDKIEILKEIETTPELLNEFTKSKKSWVRATVAGNPNIDLGTLKKLAKDEDSGVREAVAGNPKTDLKTLKELAEDEAYLVRCAVAKNQNTDLKTLKLLATDQDVYVREAIAANPNMNLEIMKLLAVDEFWAVREAVAGNPKTDSETLKKLAEDKNWYVRGVAVRHLKFLG